MSKYFIMFVMAITAMSCSKKIEVSGNFAGGSPLERIEFIEASGVATLPLVNLGVDAKGSFSGSFEAPKDGMYIMTYAGKQAMLYLKGGQKLNISGNAVNFPETYTVTGDAKKNNDFLLDAVNQIQEYTAKIDVGTLVAKDEAGFLKEVDKIRTDLQKRIDAAAKKNSPDSEAVQWKKDELDASVLGLMNQYELNHGEVTGKADYKVSKNFTDAEAKLKTNEDRLLNNQPIYRNYLLGKISPDFQQYAMKHTKTGEELSSALFADFLDTRKELSPLAKDYLLAFVMSSSDINPSSTSANTATINKLIKEKIKNATIKKDLERIQFVIAGPNVGDPAPAAKLIGSDGKDLKLNEKRSKPLMVTFYASWNPYIKETTVPVLGEVVKFYQSKMDFAFVNLDDTKDQFAKTSKALLQGIKGTNLYAEGGMNSQIAKDLGIYGFKLPSFIIIDKNGNVASKFFYNLGDPELVHALDKITGLKAPEAKPEISLQNDLLQSPPPPATDKK